MRICEHSLTYESEHLLTYESEHLLTYPCVKTINQNQGFRL